MARPKLNHEIDADAFIGFRLQARLRDEFMEIVKRNGSSIAEEARLAVQAHVKQHRRKDGRA